MTDEQWRLFAELITVDVMIRWQCFDTPGVWQEGMLLELYPYTSTEITSPYGDAGENSIRLLCQSIDKRSMLRLLVTALQFRIQGEWLNFWQVMTRDTP